MIEQKAKAILRKYQILRISAALIAVVLYAICWKSLDAWLSNNSFENSVMDTMPIYIGAIVCIVVAEYLLLKCILNFLSRKYILGILTNQLDAPLFSEIVKQGKIYHPSAFRLIDAQYYTGNYQDVVSICTKNLKVEKLAKKFKYNYLACLANVYFDIGDDEKLKEICNKFHQCLATEKTKDKILKKSPRFGFFDAYLSQNLDACDQYLNKPATYKIPIVRNTYDKARIALMKDEADEAKRLFESILQQAPKLNYAMIAQHGIDSIDKGVNYQDTFDPIFPDEYILIPELPKVRKILHIIFRTATRFLLVFAILYFLNIAMQYKQYEKEHAAYKESVRLTLEQQYDSVEVLEVFYLRTEEEIADNMFICLSDEHILIGSLFYYKGDDTIYFETKAKIALTAFDSESKTVGVPYFSCTTTDYVVNSYFYKNRQDIPDEKDCAIKITVNGKELYYIVTDIMG